MTSAPVPDSPPTVAETMSSMDPAPVCQPLSVKQPETQSDVQPPSKVTGEFNVLCYTLLSLFILSFAVWAVFAWIGYGKRYAPLAEGFYLGGTRSIEITLVREDVNNLDCASDVALEGVHCAYRADQQPFAPGPTPDPVRLRPYNTADNVLFLGAGLWSSPGLPDPFPAERFTVTCNYRMVGTIKSVMLRWAPDGAFGAVKNALPAGVLSDCVIPR
jgi:hypothetical protein